MARSKIEFDDKALMKVIAPQIKKDVYKAGDNIARTMKSTLPEHRRDVADDIKIEKTVNRKGRPVAIIGVHNLLGVPLQLKYGFMTKAAALLGYSTERTARRKK